MHPTQPPVVAEALQWQQFSNNIGGGLVYLYCIYVDNFQMNNYWVKGVLLSISGKDQI